MKEIDLIWLTTCKCIVVILSPLLQVGILLHYSTLATALWVGVTARNIYKQVTRKAKRYEELDEPPPPPRPMLRYDSTPLAFTAIEVGL